MNEFIYLFMSEWVHEWMSEIMTQYCLYRVEDEDDERGLEVA
jgi:hypothetical protein